MTAELTPDEIETDYEWNTGQAVVRRFAGCDPLETPSVLVAGHGPFTWGLSAAEAAHNAVILEELARMASITLGINSASTPLADALRDRHFFRKHGASATYGQK